MSDYETLRTLLVGREIDAIDTLAKRIDALAKELDDPDAILKRLSPQIDRVIERNIGLNRDALVDTLSPIIADVLSHEIKNSGEVIAEALAPVIGKAIRVQIKTQRDEVVDALYPVIGSTVAKFVSQSFRDLLDTINAQVQHTFSTATIRRKLTAKLKGIPESELLLRENLGWKVEALFLVHKETGLLLAQKNAPDIEIGEPEMIASMLTAIRSFVNDWLARGGSESEINQIEYGDATIYLEVAGSCYVAVVLRGLVRPVLSETVSRELSAIVEEQMEAIRNFSGDLSTLDTEKIDTHLQKILDVRPENESAAREARSRWPLYLIGLSLLGVLGYGGYRTYLSYHNARIETALLERYTHDPALALYRILPHVQTRTVVLEGAVADTVQREKAERIAQKWAAGRRIENRLVVAQAPVTALERRVRTLEKRLPQTLPLRRLSSRFYFDYGSHRVASRDRDKIDLIASLMQLYPETKILLVGYSDRKGDKKGRLTVAKKRAESVRRMLVDAGVAKGRIALRASAAYPEDLNASTYSDAEARRVEVHLVGEQQRKDSSQ